MNRVGIAPFGDLLTLAREAVNPFTVDGGGGVIGAVGAALETVDGQFFTGISLHLPCGLGFCAEVNAIGQMVTARRAVVTRIVAATATRILPPCGRCRETMVQVDRRNLDALVQVSTAEVVALRELLPARWQA